ncbi:MAG: hypothetical protein ACOYBC_11425 [Bilifractor sp.]|jgi:hypothetical protein
MSKFLRVLVRIMLIVLIACGAALLLPPLFGIDTVVIRSEMSNLDQGTVVYARSVSPSSLKSGDRFLHAGENDEVDSYIVKEYDDSNDVIVASASEDAAEQKFQANGDTVRKILFTVPFIGYLFIATQSTTGLMILGGILLIIIILFIISEVLRRGEEDDDEESSDEEDEDYFASLEKKKREKFNAEKEKEAEKEKKADSFPVEGEGEDFIENLKGAVSGNTLPPGESGPKAAPDEEEAVQTDGLPNVQAALEAALDGRQIVTPKKNEKPVEVLHTTPKSGEIELAIPIRSKEEFLEKAHKDGDEPEVREDEGTGIDLVDYSDCL